MRTLPSSPGGQTCGLCLVLLVTPDMAQKNILLARRCGGRIWPQQGPRQTAGKPCKDAGVPEGALHRQA